MVGINFLLPSSLALQALHRIGHRRPDSLDTDRYERDQ